MAKTKKQDLERRTESAAQTVGTKNDERLARFNDIADSADDVRKEDLTPLIEDQSTGAPDLDDAAPVIDAIQQAIEEPVTDELIERIVNGKSVKKTLNEWLNTASKVEAADEYLRAAHESVRHAAHLTPSSPDVSVQEEVEDLKALARAIQMGSEEEAVQAIRKLKTPPSPDVAKLVDERLTLRDDYALFEQEYLDLLQDPNLKRLVWDKDSDLNQSDPSMPHTQRWRKAAEEVKAWAVKISGYPKVDKAARKASVLPIPAAAGRQAAVSDEEGEESLQSVIDQMAKKRGQQQAIRH